MWYEWEKKGVCVTAQITGDEFKGFKTTKYDCSCAFFCLFTIKAHHVCCIHQFHHVFHSSEIITRNRR